MTEEMGWVRKKFFNMAKCAYKSKVSPTYLFNSWYFPTSWALNRYFTKRLEMPEEEKKLWVDYMYSMRLFPVSTEISLHSLF